MQEPVKLDLSLPEHRSLHSEWGAVVVQQYHGQVVQVPAGWMHAVFDRRPCVRVANIFTEKDKAWLYPAVSKLIAGFIGQQAADDCMPINICAFNSVRLR